MKKLLLFTIVLSILFISNDSICQNNYDSLKYEKNLREVQMKIKAIEMDVILIKNKNEQVTDSLRRVVDSLYVMIINLEKALEKLKRDFTISESNINDLERNTKEDFSEIVNKFTYTNIAFIVVTFFIIIIIIILIFYYKKKFHHTSLSINEKWVNHDDKLAQLLKNQLTLIKEEREKKLEETSYKELDHSLALRVGEEIHRMRLRISNMEPGTKGLTALKNSLRRLEDEFNEQGYEFIELKGKPFDENVTALPKNFVAVEGLKKGEEIIYRVIKPQIKYKGIVIYHGDIEVGVCEEDLAQ